MHTIIVSNLDQKEIEENFSSEDLAYAEKLPEEKKQNWLCGRLAAKKAVMQYLQSKEIADVSPCAISIHYNLSGVPVASLKGKINNETCLTIAHGQNVGIAAVCDQEDCKGIGVDVEKIRRFGDEFLRNFLTFDEYEYVGTFEKQKKDELTMLYWCIKEAYLKAVGVGLKKHPKFVEIVKSEKKFNIYDQGKKIAADVEWKIFNNCHITATVKLLWKEI